MGLADGVAWERDYGAPERRTVAGQQSGVSAIDAIEKAMEGVTPGPWVVHQTVIHGRVYGGHWVEVADEDQLIQISGSGGARSFTQRVFDTQDHDDNEANAWYVAACSPDRMRQVLALARQTEALQRENAELRAVMNECHAALKMMISPGDISGSTVASAFAAATSAECRARTLLNGGSDAQG